MKRMSSIRQQWLIVLSKARVSVSLKIPTIQCRPFFCFVVDGGHENEDDDAEEKTDGTEGTVYGSFRNRSAGALDLRSKFIDFNQSYLLYLWHMLEKHGLLGSSLQRLNDTVAAGNGGEGVPSIVLRTVNNDTPTAMQSFDDSASVSINHKADIERLSMAIENLTEMDAREQQRNRDANRLESRLTFLQNSLETLKSQKRELEEKSFENKMKKNKAGIQFYKHQIKRVSQDIRLKETQVNDLLGPVTAPHLTTPQRRNTTPVAAPRPGTAQQRNTAPDSPQAIPVAGVASTLRRSPRHGTMADSPQALPVAGVARAPQRSTCHGTAELSSSESDDE
jgi:hypothetical protein